MLTSYLDEIMSNFQLPEEFKPLHLGPCYINSTAVIILDTGPNWFAHVYCRENNKHADYLAMVFENPSPYDYLDSIIRVSESENKTIRIAAHQPG